MTTWKREGGEERQRKGGDRDKREMRIGETGTIERTFSNQVSGSRSSYQAPKKGGSSLSLILYLARCSGSNAKRWSTGGEGY